jgi:hypothetical protein
MTRDTANVLVGEGWRYGLEAGVCGRIRDFIEDLLEQELTVALGRARYARPRASERGKRICCRQIGYIREGAADLWTAPTGMAAAGDGGRLGSWLCDNQGHEQGTSSSAPFRLLYGRACRCSRWGSEAEFCISPAVLPNTFAPLPPGIFPIVGLDGVEAASPVIPGASVPHRFVSSDYRS